MKRGKYLVSGLILMALLVTGLLTTAGAGTGPKRPDMQQWEYANYHVVALYVSPRTYTWSAPGVYITESYDAYNYSFDDSNARFWRTAGFQYGTKEVTISDWLNFLGWQGWELVSVTHVAGATDYWFKRPCR